MLFPSDLTPYDNGSWGVTIEYEEDGYVSDDEAIELIGWAAEPYYDKASHKMHWAKEIKFGSQERNTLNYNIRILGRKGVLVLNFIASMAQKDLIDCRGTHLLEKVRSHFYCSSWCIS